jgi:hypothetical protein
LCNDPSDKQSNNTSNEGRYAVLSVGVSIVGRLLGVYGTTLGLPACTI